MNIVNSLEMEPSYSPVEPTARSTSPPLPVVFDSKRPSAAILSPAGMDRAKKILKALGTQEKYVKDQQQHAPLPVTTTTVISAPSGHSTPKRPILIAAKKKLTPTEKAQETIDEIEELKKFEDTVRPIVYFTEHMIHHITADSAEKRTIVSTQSRTANKLNETPPREEKHIKHSRIASLEAIKAYNNMEVEDKASDDDVQPERPLFSLATPLVAKTVTDEIHEKSRNSGKRRNGSKHSHKIESSSSRNYDSSHKQRRRHSREKRNDEKYKHARKSTSRTSKSGSKSTPKLSPGNSHSKRSIGSRINGTSLSVNPKPSPSNSHSGRSISFRTDEKQSPGNSCSERSKSCRTDETTLSATQKPSPGDSRSDRSMTSRSDETTSAAMPALTFKYTKTKPAIKWAANSAASCARKSTPKPNRKRSSKKRAKNKKSCHNRKSKRRRRSTSKISTETIMESDQPKISTEIEASHPVITKSPSPLVDLTSYWDAGQFSPKAESSSWPNSGAIETIPLKLNISRHVATDIDENASIEINPVKPKNIFDMFDDAPVPQPSLSPPPAKKKRAAEPPIEQLYCEYENFLMSCVEAEQSYAEAEAERASTACTPPGTPPLLLQHQPEIRVVTPPISDPSITPTVTPTKLVAPPFMPMTASPPFQTNLLKSLAICDPDDTKMSADRDSITSNDCQDRLEQIKKNLEQKLQDIDAAGESGSQDSTIPQILTEELTISRHLSISSTSSSSSSSSSSTCSSSSSTSSTSTTSPKDRPTISASDWSDPGVASDDELMSEVAQLKQQLYAKRRATEEAAKYAVVDWEYSEHNEQEESTVSLTNRTLTPDIVLDVAPDVKTDFMLNQEIRSPISLKIESKPASGIVQSALEQEIDVFKARAPTPEQRKRNRSPLKRRQSSATRLERSSLTNSRSSSTHSRSSLTTSRSITPPSKVLRPPSTLTPKSDVSASRRAITSQQRRRSSPLYTKSRSRNGTRSPTRRRRSRSNERNRYASARSSPPSKRRHSSPRWRSELDVKRQKRSVSPHVGRPRTPPSPQRQRPRSPPRGRPRTPPQPAPITPERSPQPITISSSASWAPYDPRNYENPTNYTQAYQLAALTTLPKRTNLESSLGNVFNEAETIASLASPYSTYSIPVLGSSAATPFYFDTSTVEPRHSFANLIEIQQKPEVETMSAMANTTVIVQKGNMLEIVPSANVTHRATPPLPVAVPKRPLSADESRVRDLQRADARIKRQQKSDKKRLEQFMLKEKLKLYIKQMHMFLEQFELRTDVEGGEVSEQFYHRFVYDKNAPIGRSCLQRSNILQTAEKHVLFADGITPGMGTSSSDSTDEMIPLPFRSRASRNKRNKRKSEQDEKKAKLDSRNDRTANSKTCKDEDPMVITSFIDPELENLPPPPPPAGDPPPNTYKCELKSAKTNVPQLVYFHYDPVLQDIYISPLSKLQPRPGTITNTAGGPIQRITPPLHGTNVAAIARITDFIHSPAPLPQKPALQLHQRSAFVNVPFPTSPKPSQLHQLVQQPPPQQQSRPQASTSTALTKIPSRPPSPTVPYPGGGTPSPPTTLPVVFANILPAKISHRRVSTPMLPQQYRRQMPPVRSMPSFQQPPLSSAWDPLPTIQPVQNRPFGAALLPTPHIEQPLPKPPHQHLHQHHPGSPLLQLQARPIFGALTPSWTPTQFTTPKESYPPRFLYRVGPIPQQQPPVPMLPPQLQGQRHDVPVVPSAVSSNN